VLGLPRRVASRPPDLINRCGLPTGPRRLRRWPLLNGPRSGPKLYFLFDCCLCRLWARFREVERCTFLFYRLRQGAGPIRLFRSRERGHYVRINDARRKIKVSRSLAHQHSAHTPLAGGIRERECAIADGIHYSGNAFALLSHTGERFWREKIFSDFAPRNPEAVSYVAVYFFRV